MTLNDQSIGSLTLLKRASPLPVPRSVASRYAVPWAESIEGAVSSNETRDTLCRYRSRLLLAEIPKGTDRNEELKRRIRHNIGSVEKWMIWYSG